MPLEISYRLRYLHQDKGVKVCELGKQFKDYSKSNIYLHAKKPMHTVQSDRLSENKGWPQLLTARYKRNLIQGIHMLRRSIGSFSIWRLKLEAGIDKQISDYTVRRLLNRKGYNYRQSRKKGLLSQKDLKLRVQFARKVKRLFPDTIQTQGIGFYHDGTSFAHKRNPWNQARSTKSVTWRKRKEGLLLNCTAQVTKVGCGGKMANFIVAMAYNQGVVLCEQYHELFTGECFANFIRNHFDDTFSSTQNPNHKLFLQDADPRQNYKKAKRALEEIGVQLFAISLHSPDINPIENLFYLVQKRLDAQALFKSITQKYFIQFFARIKNTLQKFLLHTINKIIESMNTRMSVIIKYKDQRIKY